MTEAIYPVDNNHGGVRLVAFLAMIGGFLIAVFGVPPMIRSIATDVPPALLAMVIGFFLAVGLAWLSERVLRRIWPSGRILKLDDHVVAVRELNGAQTALNWNAPIHVSSWFFVIRSRRAWIPKGWYCVALRIQQGDDSITPYTFLKPEIAHTLPAWEEFEQLVPRPKHRQSSHDTSHIKLLEAQADLRIAEGERWQYGCEMEPQHFAELVSAVRERVTWGARESTG